MIYINPKLAVHPLRSKLTDDEISEIFRKIDADDDSVTLDEIDCAMDWLYDFIVAQKQTHEGITTLQ